MRLDCSPLDEKYCQSTSKHLLAYYWGFGVTFNSMASAIIEKAEVILIFLFFVFHSCFHINFPLSTFPVEG